MNLLPIAILIYLCLGIEWPLAQQIGLGPEGARFLVAPVLTIPVLAYVALYAPSRQVQWLALAVGIVADLLRPPITLRGDTPALWLIGPNAVGYLLGAYAIIVMRGYLIKRNPFTLPAMSLVMGVLAALVASIILTFRYQLDFQGTMVGKPGAELLTRLGSAVYTAAIAFPMLLVLRPLTGVMGLAETYHRRILR